ncbi:MAG: OsmC family protein [Bacteroidia bacterium]|jgi:putative redox protein|nr:OsmC family protein [Bacteroidia bacterium]
MEVWLRRVNEAVHFEAVNDENVVVHIDGTPAIGGEGKGFRPMQMLLAAVAGCSVLDVVDILRKQREPLLDMQVRATGERKPDATPAPFVGIHLHFIVTGAVDPDKVARAVALAVDKYCSVKESLDKSIPVTYSSAVIAPQA